MIYNPLIDVLRAEAVISVVIKTFKPLIAIRS